ncbi:MAG: phage DNA encapsidation protein [Mycoplasmoidaceae bacterium]
MKRKNSDYFDIQQYLDHYDKEFPSKNRQKLIIINAVRNIGKSYSTWKYAERVSMRPDAKLIYMRNFDEQVKFAVRDFNDKFYGKFQATSTHIYTSIPFVIKGPDGEDVINYKRGQLVGYMISLSTYYKYKSGEFNNVNLLFFEEYNQKEAYKQFDNFISLGKTIQRFNEVELIFIGNRETANNEFMVAFGIDPVSEEERDNDVMIPVYNGNDDTEVIGGFFEIGNKTYEGLGNKDMLIDKIAGHRQSADSYMKGGYLEDYSLYIINFKKHIEKTFLAKFSFAIENLIYTFGKFGDKKFAIVRQENYYDDKLKLFSLDALSDQIKKSRIILDDEREDILEILFSKVKNETMYFDSFDTKIEVNRMLTKLELMRKINY